MKKRYAHRCLSCFHSWFTVQPDAQALCPKCKAAGQDIYELTYIKRYKERLQMEAIALLSAATLLLLIGLVSVLLFRC